MPVIYVTFLLCLCCVDFYLSVLCLLWLSVVPVMCCVVYVKVCSVCMVRSIRLPITGIGKHNPSRGALIGKLGTTWWDGGMGWKDGGMLTCWHGGLVAW